MKGTSTILTLMLLCLAFLAQAQQDLPAKYASLITPEDLRANLEIIASDAMEGRHTGSRGQKMAAAFIRYEFMDTGLTPPVEGSYYMPVPLYVVQPTGASVTVGSTRYKNDNEVMYIGTSTVEENLPLVFAGKGREEDMDYLDLKGKAVVLFLETATADTELIRQCAEPSAKAYAKGAKMVFCAAPFAENQFEELVKAVKPYFSQGMMSLSNPQTNNATNGFFITSTKTASAWLSLSSKKLEKTLAKSPEKKPNAKVKPTAIAYTTGWETTQIESENVLGFMEGTDKKDEVVVITAHFDHIGVNDGEGDDLINNGADDDGSGTVAVLQMARAFAKAREEGHGPRRSILFMTVTGEEKGLFGSEYYVENPVYPLANTVANLNIDMIGRRDQQHEGTPDYVYVIGSDKLSMDLHNINENVNKKYTQLAFDYTYNDINHPDRLYQRSDHWNFAKNDVPIIFYFDGIHEDYHKVSDEVDKIDFGILTKRTQLIFHTAWELVNREERIKNSN